ncbi:MAG: tRNA lysidine(34) synthetase TilS [Lachnospiraceae bacterium]
MSSLFDRVYAYVEKYHMLAAGDVVAAGISGGADSVCLLFVLSALREKIPFRLSAVHVNHGIRPEAGEDADYVRTLCDGLQIPFYLYETDVAAYAKEQGISTEEAGRKVRYEAFREVLKKESQEESPQGKVKIAVAHHMDDRAETMLFHLFRGSGLAGLCSIRPYREDDDGVAVIRPLLGFRREEIEAYLSEKNISWCEDSTNGEDVYIRNRIRHKILPCAEQDIVPKATLHMCRTADLLTEAEDFIRQETQKAYTGCVREKKEQLFIIDRKKFTDCHVCLQKNILLCVLKKLTAAGKDITSAHIEQLLSLFNREGNRQIGLPYQITGERKYDIVVISKTTGDEKKDFPEEWTVPVVLPAPGEPEQFILLPDKTLLGFQVIICEKTINIPQNQYTKWFDYDKIEKPLKIRTRRKGDYLTIDDKGSKKSLQDYMVNEKILKEMRDQIPLLCEDQHVLWVMGHRISSFYKINENTKYILQVQLRGGQESGGTC